MKAGNITRKRFSCLLVILLGIALLAVGSAHAQTGKNAPQLFRTSSACLACHNGLNTDWGEDISFGSSWRSSMMANSARDPYWQAAVRREVTDHPEAQAEIENECSRCHMPMANKQTVAEGEHGEIFSHLPVLTAHTRLDILAADGVSCTVCHQIEPDGFGTRESFVGHFEIAADDGSGSRSVMGPYQVDKGRASLMHSASQFTPRQADHVQSSELCATCHTLYTHTLSDDGEVIGELPEQVPYLEWKHSAYRYERSCQSCHMPVVSDSTAITSVLGRPRPDVSRHVFRGGNFFMTRLLNAHRAELGTTALPEELASTARATIEHLETDAARIAVNTILESDSLNVEVSIENLAGHKLPTAYPSRRVWIHLTIRDSENAVVFESGALRRDGSIVGNDNDDAADRYEPHHARLTRPDQVQIYEAIMVKPDGSVTTGLLEAIRFEKDNRVLPSGFVKETAEEDIAVRGAARGDQDFTGGSDSTPYVVDVEGRDGPFTIEAELRYQPIAFRWAMNLAAYDSPEPQRFTRYYREAASQSSVVLASITVRTED